MHLRPSGSSMVETTLRGLLKTKYFISSFSCRRMPSTCTVSRSGSMRTPGSTTREPLTSTRPPAIISSQTRRDATPALAMTFCRRTPSRSECAAWARSRWVGLLGRSALTGPRFWPKRSLPKALGPAYFLAPEPPVPGFLPCLGPPWVLDHEPEVDSPPRSEPERGLEFERPAPAAPRPRPLPLPEPEPCGRWLPRPERDPWVMSVLMLFRGSPSC